MNTPGPLHLNKSFSGLVNAEYYFLNEAESYISWNYDFSRILEHLLVELGFNNKNYLIRISSGNGNTFKKSFYFSVKNKRNSQAVQSFAIKVYNVKGKDFLFAHALRNSFMKRLANESPQVFPKLYRTYVIKGYSVDIEFFVSGLTLEKVFKNNDLTKKLIFQVVENLIKMREQISFDGLSFVNPLLVEYLKNRFQKKIKAYDIDPLAKGLKLFPVFLDKNKIVFDHKNFKNPVLVSLPQDGLILTNEKDTIHILLNCFANSRKWTFTIFDAFFNTFKLMGYDKNEIFNRVMTQCTVSNDHSLLNLLKEYK